MTREEAEEFWASEDGARKDYPGAIRSFVGTVQSLAATEKERDELRATVARVEALADSLEVLGNLPIEERPDGLTATVKACTALAGDLRAALHPEQEAHDA